MSDAEGKTEAPTGDSAKPPETLGFDYIKSNFFRVMFADGFLVGMTPTGLIHFEFFNQRPPIPTHVVHSISADGRLGEELRERREARTSIVREVDGEIILQLQVAKSLIQHLQEMVNLLEKLEAHAELDVGLPQGPPFDEFTARLLACSVAQFPGAAAVVLDLSSAGPIRGKALAVVARVFGAGRQVRVRGSGDGHEGLLALSSRAERSQPAPVLSLAAHRALHRSSELDLPAGYANAAA